MSQILQNKRTTEKLLLTIFGNLIYAAGNNLAIMPLHLYSGGFTGIAQLIRTVFIHIIGLPVPKDFDIFGVIYFLINVPFFLYAYKIMGKKFCLTTLFSIGMASVCLSIIPIPVKPLIEDRMLAAFFGGLGSGVGAGMVLRAGSSQGGQDLLGVCLAKTHPNFKVGTVGIKLHITGTGKKLEALDNSHKFHSVICGQSLTARQFTALAGSRQYRSPTARAGIA